MFIQTLNLQNFRSYPALSISFPPRGALLEGLNGAGKTNILEAIHLLCTGRSQRGAARTDMIHHGQDSAFIEGQFGESSLTTPPSSQTSTPQCTDILVPPLPSTSSGNGVAELVEATTSTTAALGFSRDKKVVMKRDGIEIRSYSEWFGERPVVSFGTDDLELVYGSPETRRKFLDMLICQMDRSYLEALTSYRKNMACRNALLGRTNDSVQFEVYEHAMASSASALTLRRTEIAAELRPVIADFYAQIGQKGEMANIEYFPKIKCDFSSISEWQNVYLNTLAECRKRDAELMYTSAGPHRDDIKFFLDGKPAKAYASQGQCRTFALSLKLGSVLLLERHRKDSMIFLIDDAVSELDPERTSRVYPLLEGRGQIFIATPRCQVEFGKDVLKCTVEPGKVTFS
jgi:DNA replication and repair protein RecF